MSVPAEFGVERKSRLADSALPWSFLQYFPNLRHLLRLGASIL